jgi:hypothetical protein
VGVLSGRTEQGVSAYMLGDFSADSMQSHPPELPPEPLPKSTVGTLSLSSSTLKFW